MKEIEEALREKGYRYARSSLYQELRKLKSQSVVLHFKGEYSIRPGWIEKYQEFGGLLAQQSLSSSYLRRHLPSPGLTVRWKFRKLSEFGRFATHLMTLLVDLEKVPELYEWIPYAWYILTHSSEEEQFLTSLRRSQVRHSIILGEDNTINQFYAEQVEAIGGRASFADSPFHDKMNRYEILIGKYSATAVINASLQAVITAAFGELEEPATIPKLQKMARSLDQTGVITLTVRNAHRTGNKIHRNFVEYFDV
ncbi:hypothetical protein MRY87_10300 [bacterium]|nr:hypothetical protein [bacterium]